MSSHTPQNMVVNDRFARLAGIELLSAADGHSAARMPLRDEHMNGLNIAHGGAVFTLADLVFGAACNSHGYSAVALSASIHFVKASTAGDTLHAECHVLSRGSRIGSYDVRITNDAGEIVALFQGLAYRKSK